MSSRVNYYFRQRVTEAELDLAFGQLEQADRALAADVGIFGILTGAVPTQHTPVPDLSVDLTSPTRAYDRLGQRIFVGTDQTVNCAVDLVGIPTTVTTTGHERWLAIFLRFDRQLSDPRTDGNSQQVYFRRDESFELVVRQAPEGPVGSASQVALQQDELLVCDIRLAYGQTQILNEHIELGRRQAFVLAEADAIAVEPSAWSTLPASTRTTQDALDATDEVFTEHLSGSARRHDATHIDLVPPDFLTATDVQGALDELLSALRATLEPSGAARVGASGIPGAPLALGPGTVASQLAALLARLNEHVGATQAAHAASAIRATPHHDLTSLSVQAQLEELVGLLEAATGASRVGASAVAGLPRELAPGTVASQLAALLSGLNAHATGGDHDERYFLRAEPVTDSLALGGEPPIAFSRTSHDHDGRYLRPLFVFQQTLAQGASARFGSSPLEPVSLDIRYSRILSSGSPESTRWRLGPLHAGLNVWMNRVVSSGEVSFELWARNTNTDAVQLTLSGFGVT